MHTNILTHSPAPDKTQMPEAVPQLETVIQLVWAGPRKLHLNI